LVIVHETSSLAALLTALADPTRLAIVELLTKQDRCVCHLVELLELKQSVVSHHLGVLRHAGLVSAYAHPTDRRWQYYHLEREVLSGALTGLSALLDHAQWDPAVPTC
jgi:ArsR family transcriptional regulator